ncbi:MAG TPA: tRNA (N6-threonylcarbamoyladenosine(37)-N6)-methyltransferase TrmO [Burkholderiales bacterium]|nr:tRNA (N6-threonylcarbamoyladenosine(37)-N6)-methyltransferase TrmO [Burkholderiales bacterium]
MFQVHPIGTAHCPVDEMSQGNWATVESEIRLDPSYAPGLQGLEGFSHVLVLFFLDRAQGFDLKKQLLRRPRGMEDLQELGVFAQRTKYRPNPIGVTAVKLLGIEGSVVRVQGLDALDGTPVLDIKPYMPPFDRMDDVTMPPWVGRFIEGYF